MKKIPTLLDVLLEDAIIDGIVGDRKDENNRNE